MFKQRGVPLSFCILWFGDTRNVGVPPKQKEMKKPPNRNKAMIKYHTFKKKWNPRSNLPYIGIVCVCVIPPPQKYVYIYICICMVVEWSCWCWRNPANHLRLVVHSMICRGFLVGTGISEPSTVPVQQNRVRFLHFLTSDVTCRSSASRALRPASISNSLWRDVSGRKNSPGLTGKRQWVEGKKKLNKVFRNFNNPLPFFESKEI